MKRIIVFTILLIPIFLYSQNTLQFRVKYISAQNIYLDGGKAAGLAAGDTLIIMRGAQPIATVKVVYAAENSASCQVLRSTATIQQGDRALLLKKSKKQTKKQVHRVRKRTVPRRKSRTERKNGVDFSGSVSLQWYHIKDLSSTSYNFDQPGVRLNLKIRNLFNGNYRFRIKTRSRYNKRARQFSTLVPRREWRNRIYELSFAFDDEKAAFNYRFGRIISNSFSGIGYIDGFLLQHNYTPQLRLGVFAGTQPEWHYSRFQTSLQKYGAYLNFIRGDYRHSRFESTIAAAGEYHGSVVSREFIYFQNSFRTRNGLSIYQNAEIDLNRDWRKEKTQQDVALTNLYVNASYKFSRWVTVGLSYNNRKNYYTYEIRTVADSLFDDAMRYGLRGNLYLRLPNNYHVYSNFGLRKRETDTQYTYSFAGGVNKSNLSSLRLFLGIRATGFSNYYSEGYNFSMRMGKYFRGGHNAYLSYGAYTYSLNAGGTRRFNNWIRLNSMIQLFGRFFLTEYYEYSWGSDYPGQRIYGELGYRF